MGTAMPNPQDHVEDAQPGNFRREAGLPVEPVQPLDDVGALEEPVVGGPHGTGCRLAEGAADDGVVDRKEPRPLAGEQLAGRDPPHPGLGVQQMPGLVR